MSTRPEITSLIGQALAHQAAGEVTKALRAADEAHKLASRRSARLETQPPTDIRFGAGGLDAVSQASEEATITRTVLAGIRRWANGGPKFTLAAQ